ncbi:MAG TPA: hypothetical protein VMJ30_03630 [Gemmatimonadales bacterium]|nr:hypothetical protein [Gemmatimonadales bacterium]
MSSSAKVEEFGEGFDVSFGDAAAVGADDAGGEGGVVQVLHVPSTAAGSAR